MTGAREILLDAFDRVHELVPTIIHGLAVDELLWRPDGSANSLGWLVWHLTRVQDDHLAGVGATEQVYLAEGWSTRFALPYDDRSIGYGHSAAEVGAFRLEDPELLISYHAAVHALTRRVVEELSPADYDRVVDDRWDPPVTAAVRLVSVVGDTLQHLGQAAYVRGLVERR